jgi:hypothetical protein
MVGYIPLDETIFWGLVILCSIVLVLMFVLKGSGKYWGYAKTGSVIGLVVLVMGGLVFPAVVPLAGGGSGNGNQGFTPLFEFSIARSADCNDLTGLDAVADCVAAAEENTWSEDRRIDMLFTIDQELVTVLAPDEGAFDFALERVCDGDPANDPIHCPFGQDEYLPATVECSITSIPTVHNLTISDDIDFIETTSAGVDIVAWSDGTNVVLGKHSASPLSLEPGQEGTITFSFEADPIFFGADTITDEMSLGSLDLSIAGQTVNINIIVVSYTA